jgi:hypothetical protein
MTELGEYLRAARDARSFGLREFSRFVGHPTVYIQKVERGEVVSPSDKYLEDCAFWLVLDPDEVFARAGRVAPDLVRFAADTPALVRLMRWCQTQGMRPIMPEPPQQAVIVDFEMYEPPAAARDTGGNRATNAQ